MGQDFPLEFWREALGTICRRYGVRRLSAFGAVLREDFLAGSDVDVLVGSSRARPPCGSTGATSRAERTSVSATAAGWKAPTSSCSSG